MTSRIAPLFALLVAACGAPQQAVRTPVPERINDGFLADDVDVERFAARWELESREVYAGRKEILAALDVRPGETVADIGTGTGLFVEPLAAATGVDGRVYAVDIAPAFVFHVRERAAEKELDQVEVVLSNARSTELPVGSVDVAFLCDTYHHFEYHEDMLRSIRSALKPGGRLVMVEFDRVPGVTRKWLLDHVRAGREVFLAEVEAAGFRLVDEVEIPVFEENYCVRFARD
ncbi:MAG: methyltransferase domain-containing protein [Planctomycetota bacterium]